MKISIICVGKLKEKYWNLAIDEYSKRLSKYIKLEIIEVPDEKAPETMSLAEEEIVKKERKRKQIYSFEQDDFLIYSAFMEQYHIDLNEANLHWWKFKAMFDGLNDDILFSKVMGYRSIDLSKIEDKKQREHYAKLQKHWALVDSRSVEEKESDFANALW